MGTNYYIKFDECPHCGSAKREYHIGKYSTGWTFALHIDKTIGVNNLEDIKALWKGQTIRDEYNAVITEKEMSDTIENLGSDIEFDDKPLGYESWDEFHRANNSEFGPGNLLRRKIDGRHCIGHGKDGTYDYVKGEFF